MEKSGLKTGGQNLLTTIGGQKIKNITKIEQKRLFFKESHFLFEKILLQFLYFSESF